jgi:hypothetical protein
MAARPLDEFSQEAARSALAPPVQADEQAEADCVALLLGPGVEDVVRANWPTLAEAGVLALDRVRPEPRMGGLLTPHVALLAAKRVEARLGGRCRVVLRDQGDWGTAYTFFLSP